VGSEWTAIHIDFDPTAKELLEIIGKNYIERLEGYHYQVSFYDDGNIWW